MREADLKLIEIEQRNKSTFELVLRELYLIREEHDSQIAKFDLLVDK